MILIVLFYIILFRPGTISARGGGVRAVTAVATNPHEKIETLPESALLTPEQYIITISEAVVDIDDFVVSILSLYNVDDIDDEIIQFVYNFISLPSSTTTINTVDPIRGRTISHVNDTILQWLMNSNDIATITPVRWSSLVVHVTFTIL
jgi:hypothetical protein